MKKKTNKKHLIIGGAIIGGAAITGLYILNQKNKIVDLEEQIKTLNEACSESLFEEACATVTRKLNLVKDRIGTMQIRMNSNPDDNQNAKALEIYNDKLVMLQDRLNKFVKARELYEINGD